MGTLAKSLLIITVAGALIAQNPGGSVNGTIQDEQGAVIPGARLTVTNKATGERRSGTTQPDGAYAFTQLLPGQYEIRAEFEGFATLLRTLTVEAGSATSADISMKIGQSNQVVEVSAEAPLVDRTTFQISGHIDQKTVDAMPLNGRNYLQLAQLEPGVDISARASTAGGNVLFNVSIGGASAFTSTISVDGGSIMQKITGGSGQNFSTESIQEFQIQRANIDLSTGGGSAGAINIVSRTGTNTLHGSGFLFVRDHTLAAVGSLGRDPLEASPFFRREQFGGSVGGPFKKNKTFYFANIERLNQTSSYSDQVLGFPSLSQFTSVLSSPYTGLQSNGRIDHRFNDRYTFFARYSNDTNDSFAPEAVGSLYSNWHNNGSRVHNAQAGLTIVHNAKLVENIRFNFQHNDNPSGLTAPGQCSDAILACIGFGGPRISVTQVTGFIIGNGAVVPQLRYYNRDQLVDNVSWFLGKHQLRFGGEWEHSFIKGIQTSSRPALMSVYNPQRVLTSNATVAASTMLTQAQKDALTIPLAPNFTTPGAKITIQDILSLPLNTGQEGFGNPELPTPFSTDEAKSGEHFRFFLQDNWRVHRNFTLIYGLSYQVDTKMNYYDLARPQYLAPLVPTAPAPRDLDNFAPAAGFAWDVKGDGKTVIRGGAGIYYTNFLDMYRLYERSALKPVGSGQTVLTGTSFSNPIQFPTVAGAPATLAIVNPAVGAPLQFLTGPTKFTGQNFLDALKLQTPVIQQRADSAAAQGISGIQYYKTGTQLLTNLELGYSPQFNIGVQRKLPWKMALAVDGVMRNVVHGIAGPFDLNLNNRVAARGGPVIPRCTGTQAQDPLAICSTGQITFYQTIDRSSYRAIQVKLEKRFTQRVQFTVSYSLSTNRGFALQEDLTNWFGYPEQLAVDARHRLTISGVVNLPWRFELGFISSYTSLPPVNATVPYDLNGDGTTSDTLPGLAINSLNRGTSRAEFVEKVNKFNRDYAGKTDARGTLIQPVVLPSNYRFNDSLNSQDLRVTRSFKIRERGSLQIFGEAFNLFNIANLAGFTQGLDVGTLNANTGAIAPPASFTFGQATSRAGQAFGSGGPRAIQLGARFRF